MNTSPTWQRVLDLVQGPPGRQRVRVSQTLLALVVYAFFAVVQHTEVMLALIDRSASNALTAFNLIGSTLFYLAIRLGLNERVKSDPSLTIAQCVFAMTSIGWSYSITGPARGAVIGIMMLVLLFGAFALTPRRASALGLYGLGVLATTMAYKAHTDALTYNPRVEAIHFTFAVVVAMAATALAARFSSLRRRLSVQKKELEEALARIQLLATRDELTGLVNRRAMMELLTNEARRVQRGTGPMCLVLIDIDHFKRVNDTHGHAAGDQVLCGFAALAGDALRGTDVLARWGGEEFMLLMPQTALDAALIGIERVRERLRAHPFTGIAADLVVTFSAGLTACADEEDLDAAIERADKAMYRAKTAGRNRTECG